MVQERTESVLNYLYRSREKLHGNSLSLSLFLLKQGKNSQFFYRIVWAKFYLHGIVTSVQMLQNFGYYLSLSRTVFFSHSTIYEFHYVSVKMSYKVLQILAMGFGIQTFPSNPFDRVSMQCFSCNVLNSRDKIIFSFVFPSNNTFANLCFRFYLVISRL